MVNYLEKSRKSICLAVVICGLLWNSHLALQAVAVMPQTVHHSVPYIQLVPARAAYSPLSDSLYYSRSLTVHFSVNKAELHADNPELRDLLEQGLSVIRENNLQFHHLEVRGGASPEGPYANNVRLSIARAQVLLDSIRVHLDIPADYMVYHTVAEDYEYLCRMMEEARDVDAAAVRAIVERYPDDAPFIKYLLRGHNGGTTWQRMLAQYFPQLRTARVVFYYIIGTETAPLPVAVQGQPMQANLAVLPFRSFRAIRRPLLSIKNNLLYDGCWLPDMGMAPVWNVALEYYPRHGRYTAYAQFDCPWQADNVDHSCFQARNYTLALRRYFRTDASFTGSYLAVSGQFLRYDLEFSNRRGWQGEGLGASIGYGYVLPLGKDSRWKLDFSLGLGFLALYYDSYDPYTNKEHTYYYSFPKVSEHTMFQRPLRRYWLGPTSIGVSLSYDLLFSPLRNAPNPLNLFSE